MMDNFATGLYQGLTTCEGCGMELTARKVMEILGPDTIVITPPSCSAILTGYGRETGWKIPSFQSNLESVAAYASGIRVGLEVLGKDHINVLGFAGDGGTIDIGLQALSGAIERGHRFIYLCYNNEAYMNTGIQRSGATPYGASTKTTPGGKKEKRKDIDGMLLAQELAYQATASIAYLKDLKSKMAKAKEADGPVFIHVHTPCATGWKFPVSQTINVARLAVKSGLWVLWERENDRVKINIEPQDWGLQTDYLRMQGRFKNINSQDQTKIKSESIKYYQSLKARGEEL